MFSILLLAYYKLSHPQLGFDKLEFHIGESNEESTITTAQYLNSIYDGSFITAKLLKI